MTPGKSMKNIKYCAITLNMYIKVDCLEYWGFTVPIILISKKVQNKFVYILNSPLCAPIARAAIKQLLLGA